MTHHFHAVVWIDHREAYIYEIGTEGVNELHIKSPDHEGHIHHKAGSVGSGHSHDPGGHSHDTPAPAAKADDKSKTTTKTTEKPSAK